MDRQEHVEAEYRRWCVVQTKPREEEIAIAHLRRQGFDVFMPLLRERRRTESKIVPMFPGYVFVEIDPTALDWMPIASTRGVKRLMTTRPEKPALLPRHWVEELRDRGVLDMFTDALSFRKGDRVEFIAGPFEGHTAVCQWTSELRIGVLFECMGRDVSVLCDPKILKPIQSGGSKKSLYSGIQQ
jgi:transcriptional antiterminator RfaH